MLRLALVVAAALAATVHAESPPDPLRLVPRQADLALRIEPVRLVNAIQSMPAFRELSQFPAVKEALDSTNSRRFLKIINYYEKELGLPWPELLDRLAGGGIVVASKFQSGEPPPALVVIQGRDTEMLRRAVALVRGVVEQELARNAAPIQPQVEPYRGVDVTQLGDVRYAQVGAALLLANKPVAIQRAIDLHLDGPKESLAEHGGPAAAEQLLPPDALARLWVNLVPAHESPQGKETFKQPKTDVIQLVLAGGLIDVIGKSPFLAAGLYRTDGGLAATMRLPAGRDATPEGFGLHLAPVGQPGSLPPLEPANSLFSTSFYLDLGAIWTQRETILSDGAHKQLDDAEKRFGRFLAGRKLSELLTQSGPYHRFVVAAQTSPGYSRSPDVMIPAFAFASSMRAPEFGQAMGAILRTVALVTGSGAKLKLVEETVDGVKLIGYRFPEQGGLTNDPQNLRFAFSPCFAAVGDQFFAASTLELGREMIGLLRASPTSAAPPTTRTIQTRLFAAGGAVLARLFEEQQVTQAILDRGIAPADAKREVEAGIAWLEKLGIWTIYADYRPSDYSLESRWEPRREKH